MTLFLIITFFPMLICVIYCHHLPFYLICGGAHPQLQPIFLRHFNKKCLQFFFYRPGRGVHLHPLQGLHPPGYAYGVTICSVEYSASWSGSQIKLNDLSYGITEILMTECLYSVCKWYTVTAIFMGPCTVHYWIILDPYSQFYQLACAWCYILGGRLPLGVMKPRTHGYLPNHRAASPFG